MLRVPHEGDSENATCELNLISTFFSELLNKCTKEPYRAYLPSSVQNHHDYTNAHALAYSVRELGDEAYLVGISYASRNAFIISAIFWHCGLRLVTLRSI